MRTAPFVTLGSLACLCAAWPVGCTRSDEPAPAVQLAQPAAPAPAAAQPDPAPPRDSPTLLQPIVWKEFAPQQAGFKLRFPRLPERAEKRDDTPDGQTIHVVFVSLAPEHDGAYSLTVTEYPQALVDRTPDARFFEDATWTLVHNMVGKILSQKDLDLQGRKGKEFELVGAGPLGRTRYYARVFRAGTRGYQLFAAFPEGKEKADLVRLFLDSFVFVD
ncbi:MAG TPA: hypothetical protein PK668_11935 [Myxococcota bacterium]|nr:hypothetical protein [Myxococcota bacterium]HRY93823.1 hypothetical protein [Myxococcota bacterium]